MNGYPYDTSSEGVAEVHKRGFSMGVEYTSKNRFLVQVTVIASEINIVEWGESRGTLRIHDTIVILNQCRS
jgi:hypothetical protein